MLTGSCLCGGVTFKVNQGVTDIYQCHCSVCRKATGSAGISVCLAAGDDFEWLSGKGLIELYTTDSGYRSVFCRCCGSRLPDPNPDESTFWIPAGLLDQQTPGIKVGAHIFIGSKASWDVIGDAGVQHAGHFPE